MILLTGHRLCFLIHYSSLFSGDHGHGHGHGNGHGHGHGHGHGNGHGHGGY